MQATTADLDPDLHVNTDDTSEASGRGRDSDATANTISESVDGGRITALA
ncbi:MAG: hypothetical protein R3F55_21775 [Alphaproteobacteria bacterium]